MSNRNHQVTREDYARCVDQQVAFLHSQFGTDKSEHPVTRTQTDDNYDHGVSVDATADDLYHRGF
jgi:hypothetical protein